MPLLFTPKFYRDFKCAGEHCPEHCCQGWRIGIDKPTYNKYLQHPHPLIRDTTLAHMQKVKKSPKEWAQVRLDEQGLCPFLDGVGLCNIHKIAGPELLSDTCSTYPRTQQRFGEQVKRSLQLSCPEACRLVLFDPEALSLENEPYIGRIATKPVPSKDALIQSACIELLTQGVLSAEQALFFIGMMVHKAEVLDGEQLTAFCLEVLALAGKPDDVFGQLPYLPKMHAKSLLMLTRLFQQEYSNTNRRGSGTMQQCSDSLQRLLDGDLDQSRLNQLNQAWHGLVKPFLDAHPQVLGQLPVLSDLQRQLPAPCQHGHDAALSVAGCRLLHVAQLPLPAGAGTRQHFRTGCGCRVLQLPLPPAAQQYVLQGHKHHSDPLRAGAGHCPVCPAGGSRGRLIGKRSPKSKTCCKLKATRFRIAKRVAFTLVAT